MYLGFHLYYFTKWLTSSLNVSHSFLSQGLLHIIPLCLKINGIYSNNMVFPKLTPIYPEDHTLNVSIFREIFSECLDYEDFPIKCSAVAF